MESHYDQFGLAVSVVLPSKFQSTDSIFTSEFIKACLLTYKLAFRVRDGNFTISSSCDKEMECH